MNPSPVLELRLRRGQKVLGRIPVPLRNAANGVAHVPVDGTAALAPTMALDVSVIYPRVFFLRTPPRD